MGGGGDGGAAREVTATELSRDVGVQLFADFLATVFGLGVVIALLGPDSAVHFNPAVALAAWFLIDAGRS